MTDPQVLEQARIIFRTGKMIRDRVIRAHTITQQELEAEGICCDLSVAQMQVVLATRERGELTVSELAHMGGVSPPSASAMVERLVEKGILVREQSREDRRKVLVQVSPEAEKFIGRAEEGMLQIFVELVEKIGPDTASRWVEVLKRVEEVIGADNGEERETMKAKGENNS
jgi:DNA-binding MarR family transcriptional regulator